MMSVESSASAVSQSSRSDGVEQQLGVTVINDDVISLSSLEHTSLLCEPIDVADVKQSDVETTDVSESVMSEHMPTSEHEPSVDVHQYSDSEERVSLSTGDEHSCIAVDTHSQQLSDVGQQSTVNVDTAQTLTSDSVTRPSVTSSPVLSHTDQSKTDHSMISSSLKNISQSEDQGLVYIVYSKPHSYIAASSLCVTSVEAQFHVGVSLYFKQLLKFKHC